MGIGGIAGCNGGGDGTDTPGTSPPSDSPSPSDSPTPSDCPPPSDSPLPNDLPSPSESCKEPNGTLVTIDGNKFTDPGEKCLISDYYETVNGSLICENTLEVQICKEDLEKIRDETTGDSIEITVRNRTEIDAWPIDNENHVRFGGFEELVLEEGTDPNSLEQESDGAINFEIQSDIDVNHDEPLYVWWNPNSNSIYSGHTPVDKPQTHVEVVSDIPLDSDDAELTSSINLEFDTLSQGGEGPDPDDDGKICVVVTSSGELSSREECVLEKIDQDVRSGCETDVRFGSLTKLARNTGVEPDLIERRDDMDELVLEFPICGTGLDSDDSEAYFSWKPDTEGIVGTGTVRSD